MSFVRHLFAALAAMLVLTAMPALATVASGGIAWHEGASEADVDAAFARARAESRPVLLYWGAVWCPPCNQLKATLFNRQDFIALTRNVIPVYLDGDLPGAQKLGSRFKVVGYPTLLLFAPDGTEATRLPGEADPVRVVEALQRGLAGGRPTRAVLADARAGKALPPGEWQSLAFYSWWTDESQLAPPSERSAVLADLAQRAHGVDAVASTRLWLYSLATRDVALGAEAPTAEVDRLTRLLGDAVATRTHADMLIIGTTDIVRALSEPASPARHRLLAAFERALRRLQADATLSRADRVGALTSRVALARIDVADDVATPAMPRALLGEVRANASRMDREITSGYERQAVMTEVGYQMRRAGLIDESTALLQANLKKSHSPYYLMLELAGNAKAQGRKADALGWYQQAYETSVGPATRLQWGATYVQALFDLAPDDAARIERAAAAVFDDARKDKGAFYERSLRSIKRITARLGGWVERGEHGDEVARLQQRFEALCASLPAGDPQHAACVAAWPEG